ncbi:MAG: hypothetical protein IPM07_08185 [Anaerolineales bacterium]|nr:hypothetical protein [Anaerolineales bacterium]
MIGKLAAEEILNAFGRVLPGVLVEESFADVLLRDAVGLAMQAVPVRLVLVIAHRGGNREELEEPVVVGREGGGAARLGRGEGVALFILGPEGRYVERSGQVKEPRFNYWHEA